MHSDKIRFGLIGFGAWGRHHADAITKAPEAELVAICAKSDASRDAAHQAYPQATVVADYRDMLELENIDAVDIVLPSDLHHEVAAAVLDSGRHLLLEKPMCLNVADCDDLIHRAQQQRVQIAVGHELRLSSLWARVQDLIQEGFIGTPRYVLVELSRNPYRQGADGWRYDLDRVGNWILEEPIHFFDLARWYLQDVGEPQSVYAQANSRDSQRESLHDNFSAIVNFPDGAYAVVTQTLAAFEHHQTVKVTGTKGAIHASWSGALDRTRHPTFFLKKFDGDTVVQEQIDKPAGELFELEDQINMFVTSIREDTPPACTGEDGRQSVALCLAAAESAATGKVKELS